MPLLKLPARKLTVSPLVPLIPKGRLSPIVKWAGSKRKLLPELVKRLPKTASRYFEPFLGSGALYLHLEPEMPAVLSDANHELMEVYRAVAEETDSLIADLEWHQRNHSKGFYYETRDKWNSGFYDPPNTNRQAAFIYLNKTCFNGLWRVNASSEFNVPMGDYTNPKILDEVALRTAAPAFARADLRTCSYEEAVRYAGPGDFVYFDPPYIPTSPSSSFTSYTPGGFGAQQHRHLAALAHRLVADGVQVMLSNSDTPMAHDLYKGFRVDRVSRQGTISSKGSGRGRVGELVITGGYSPA